MKRVHVLKSRCGVIAELTVDHSTGHASTHWKPAPPLKWRLHDNAGSVTYDCRRHNGIDAMLGLINDGTDKAGDLAAELEVSTGCVSKWAKKLESEGTIKIEGRRYLPANV